MNRGNYNFFTAACEPGQSQKTWNNYAACQLWYVYTESFHGAIQTYLSNGGAGDNVRISLRFRAAAAADQCTNVTP